MHHSSCRLQPYCNNYVNNRLILSKNFHHARPKARVEQLKRFPQTEFGQAERVNVEALIRMYETGELGPRQIGDPPVCLVEGHCVHTDPHEDMSVPNNAMKWCETLDYRQ